MVSGGGIAAFSSDTFVGRTVSSPIDMNGDGCADLSVGTQGMRGDGPGSEEEQREDASQSCMGPQFSAGIYALLGRYGRKSDSQAHGAGES
jgi:hypothetical protein